MGVNSLISTIYGALDALFYGSKVGRFNSPFSETSAAGSSELCSIFDGSILPEIVFDDPMEGFVPYFEDTAVEEGAKTEEAATVTMEEAAVTTEEEAPLSADLEEMICLLLPPYLKLVRSFP